MEEKDNSSSQMDKVLPAYTDSAGYLDETDDLAGPQVIFNIEDEDIENQMLKDTGTEEPVPESIKDKDQAAEQLETENPENKNFGVNKNPGTPDGTKNNKSPESNEAPKNVVDDKMLVAKSQQGDKAAFEKLVRLYSKYVYTNAFFILRDSHDAEDVSQEVFVKVFLSIKNFRGLSSFKTWLRKLTINTCIDKLRIKSKTMNKKISLDTLEEGYEVVFTDLNHNIEKNFFSRETVKEVLGIIVNLEESYRIPLILRDLQDYSYREISHLINKPIGTVKTNIHRARKIIKDKMKYEKEMKR